MNKKVIYTAIFGNYDDLIEPLHKEANVDYICFTDNLDIKSKKWTVRYVDNYSNESYNMLNRRYKFFPNKFLPEYEQSLYIDGNIQLVNDDYAKLFDEALKCNDIAIPIHAERNCIYDEANACLKFKKGEPEKIEKQMRFYKSVGYPENNGLLENNIIFRRHNDVNIVALMSEWFEILTIHSSRDQLSLCYLLWKNNINCKPLYWGPKKSNKFFKIKFHNSEKKLPLFKKIYLYLLLNKERTSWHSVILKLINKVRRK